MHLAATPCRVLSMTRGIVALLLLAGCGNRSVETFEPGSLGGRCELGRCDPGLECFRGICLEPEVVRGRDAAVSRDGSAVRASDGGIVRPPDGGLAPAMPGTVASGDGALIAVFPIPAGLVVVDQSAARLVSREGVELARFASGRQITAAAFDGTYLGIADRAVLTVVGPDLTELASGTLVESCASAVIVSDHRFVCGPDNDWDRVFYTYSLETGAEIARTTNFFTYNGIPMKGVPGRDEFITVTLDLSPSDFHLYEVDASSVVHFVNESPYHGDFAATDVYTFIGSPATHLVNSQGIMLRLRGTGCVPGEYGSACLVMDGELGTLATGDFYRAMARDDAGLVYALHDPTGPSYSDPLCVGGCSIERIDPAARSVVSSTTYTDSFLAIPVFEPDPFASRIVLGVQTAGDRWDGYTAYTVKLARYD